MQPFYTVNQDVVQRGRIVHFPSGAIGVMTAESEMGCASHGEYDIIGGRGRIGKRKDRVHEDRK